MFILKSEIWSDTIYVYTREGGEAVGQINFIETDPNLFNETNPNLFYTWWYTSDDATKAEDLGAFLGTTNDFFAACGLVRSEMDRHET